MRIHSNTLTPSDVYEAVRDLRGVMADVSEHGSRTRQGALEVRLTGTSPYRTMNGQDQAATWDEWGVVMARLFEIDPEAVMGKEDRDGFDYRTGGRFAALELPKDTHSRHSWQYEGPGKWACTKCNARLGRL